MDKRRKKELRRQYKEQQFAEARRRMCLWPDQLRELRGFLSEQLFGLGIACDHTLSRTRSWAEREGLDPEQVADSMRAFGGCCDCEVLNNVTLDQLGWD